LKFSIIARDCYLNPAPAHARKYRREAACFLASR
jgi:hypothetical protein